MPSYCRFKQIECYYSESVTVSVPQDQIRGSAIHDKTLKTSKLCPRPWGISKVGPHPPSMDIREPFEVEPVGAVIGCLGGHVHGC